MVLLSLLERGVIALEKIAAAKTSLHPRAPIRQRQASELINYGQHTWQREQLRSEISKYGLAPEQASEALETAMQLVIAEDENQNLNPSR